MEPGKDTKETNLKTAYCMTPATWNSKRQNYEDNKKVSGCQGCGERDEQAEHRAFGGQWKQFA